MITKMSMVNITGPRDDIDRMSDQYLSHYDIHLENTLKELSDIRTLKPYTSPDPYKPLSQRIDDLLQLSPTEQNAAAIEPRSLDFDYIKRLVEQVEHDVKTEQEKLQKVNQEITQLTTDFNKYEPFEKIDYPLDDILIMKIISIRQHVM